MYVCCVCICTKRIDRVFMCLCICIKEIVSILQLACVCAFCINCVLSMGRSRSRSVDRKRSKREASPPKQRALPPTGKWDEGFGGVYLPTGGAVAPSSVAVNPGQSLPTVGPLVLRKLIVSGIPKEQTGPELVAELTKQILAATGHPEGFPIVNCTFLSAFGKTKSAMVEFRSPVAANVALTVCVSTQLKLKRAKDFPSDVSPEGIPVSDLSTVAAEDIGAMDGGEDTGYEGPSRRLSVYGLPGNVLPEQIVKDLFSQFGKLRYISFPKDLVTGFVRPGASGIVEFEKYEDSVVAETGLNGFPCGNSVVKITRVAATATPALVPRRAASGMSLSVTSRILGNPLLATQVKTGREIGSRPSLVVQLLNAVYPEDIAADSDYNDIVKEVKEEAVKFGNVQVIKIPRQGPGQGKIFVQFTNQTCARKFQADMNGRTFDQRIVAAAFYPLDRFLQGKYVLYTD